MLAGEGCSGAGGVTGKGVGDAPGEPWFAASGVAGGDVKTLTFPSRNPASCNVLLALPSRVPTKLGITNVCGSDAVVTSKLIFGANTCTAFAVGLCASTWSAGIPASSTCAIE